MAHECPKCGMKCHCNGDIDDLLIYDEPNCNCCEYSLEDAEFTEDELRSFEGNCVFQFSTDTKFEDVEFEIKAKNISSALNLFNHNYGYDGYYVREKK